MPTPAEEILAKAVMPTGLSSAEIRDTVSAEIRRRSFFSARTAEAEYLQKARQVCADVAAGRIGKAKARELMARFLAATGYDGTAGGPGPITDVGSEERLNLIVDTQRDMAHSVARIQAQTPEIVALKPAWRLVRVGTRKDPRNWAERWEQAAAAVNWEGVARNGEMVARKDSPIWDALGAGAGGHKDTLGNPYPPFAFNSGMDIFPVDADECESIGLDVSDLRPPKGASLAPDKDDIDRIKKKLGADWLRELEREWKEDA